MVSRACAAIMRAMCARFVSRIMAAMERMAEVRWHDPFALIYNAAPTMTLSVVAQDHDGLSVRAMKWGLIPGWWREASPPKLTINTRSEEAGDKPMWSAALRGTRCLVPALGWYEWRTESRVDTESGEVTDVRQPYFVHLEGLAPLCFAGLWSRWFPERGAEPLLTFSILTRAATPGLAILHDRMPVVLPEVSYKEWLDPSTNPARLQQLLATQPVETFQAYPVSTYVNNPKNQEEKCMQPVAATAAG